MMPDNHPMIQPYNPENYWDKVAEAIQSRQGPKIIAGDDEPFYRYKRKRFLELFDSIQFSDKSILEIGSGPGGNLDFLYHKGCKRLTGVDVSQQMVSLSRELLSGKNIEIIKTDGKNLPFADRAFDLVFTSTVLQHNTDEEVLLQLLKDICRVSNNEVLLFERIEKKIMGHESNLGRPVRYYEEILKANNFKLTEVRSLPLQASFYVCGAIRKIFNRKNRKEGEPLSRLSIALEKLALPFTSLLDKIVPSNRDVMLLRFRRIQEN